MSDFLNVISNAYNGYANYLWKSVTEPFFEGDLNYFYYLIFASLAVWGLELLFPWRKNQKAIRKDFGLDTFYMFFNFFIFNLILFIALSDVTVTYLDKGFELIGIQSTILFDFSNLPVWIQLISFFLIIDFVQWCVHNLLHRISFLWRFHKVHHSVKEMGFAAHLRYHFMETVMYNSIKYLCIAMLFNFDLSQGYIVYSLSILIGHLNHANLGWDYGPFKYLINNPKMHIWHHSKILPKTHPKGMNFGISLSLWDYIFGTNFVPSDGRDIELGFENDENYPDRFEQQLVDPFKRSRES